MNETIWLYWEGPQPPYIALCCRTVFTHNEHVVLLDRDGFEKLFKTDRDLNIDVLCLPHKADFIRAYLLQHFGGLYLDADCLVMRSLELVIALADQHGFVGYRDPLGYMSNNFMASVCNGAVISAHYAKVCETLRSGRQLEWLDISSIPLDEVIANHPDQSFILPTESVMPISWCESEQFCVERDDQHHQQHLRADAYCYMLSNNTIKSRSQTRILCDMSESDLLNKQYFLSFLLRKSLAKEY